MKIGTRVRLNAKAKKALIANGCREHVDEFKRCIGVVEGPVQWGKGESGPEVEVRYIRSKLRYPYHPDHLEVVKERKRP